MFLDIFRLSYLKYISEGNFKSLSQEKGPYPSVCALEVTSVTD